jgi:DNA modification methylase
MNSAAKAYGYDKKLMAKFEIEQVTSNERSYALVCGDSLEILKMFPDEAVSCVVTSPPYWNLREYDVAENSNVIGNEPDYRDYVKNLTVIFGEVKRILAKDGSLWLNLGDKYYNKELLGVPWRVALALMDNGWILRNDVIWEGINLMLGGAEVDAYPTEQEFIVNIIKKGIQAGVLDKNSYARFL